MPSINLDNLERYDSKARNEAEEEYMPKDSGNWQKTEEAGAVAFYPVPNTPLEGKVKFSFKETPPAEGDKSPSNPSTISGKNSVIVSHIGGKNFLSYNFASCSVKSGYTSEYYGIKCVHNEGVYTLSGTATQLRNIYITHITEEPNILKLPPGTYTLSVGLALPSGIAFHVQVTPEGGVASAKIYTGGNVTFSMDKQFKVNAYLRNGSGASYPEGGLVCRPQLEFGSVATDFEPSTVQNYTIPLGNTYYGGTLDVATGVMTVTHSGMTLNGDTYLSTGIFDEQSDVYGVGFYPDPERLMTLSDSSDAACSILPVAVGTGAKNYPCAYLANNAMGIRLQFSKTSLGLGDGVEASEVRTAVKAFLAQHPGFIVWPVAMPTAVQLTPISISSLAQTDKCIPRLNTVYTDADTIQIGYMKSPQRTEQEITQALLEIESNDSD